MERLKSAEKVVVGAKQVLKAIRAGEAEVVYLAQDANAHVTTPLKDACKEQETEYVYVDEMIKLGKACGIKVNASAAAILE